MELRRKVVSFSYTALQQDYDETATAGGGSQIFYESGDGRAETRNRPYVHSHSYSPACNWFCGTGKTTPEPGKCQGDFNDCHHSCHNDCAGGELTCKNRNPLHRHTSSCYAPKYCGHVHTVEDCHSCDKNEKCQHQYYCPYYKHEKVLVMKLI